MALCDSVAWGCTSLEMYLLMCVWYTLDDSSTADHLSNRPGNLNLLPKQLKGLSAWMEVQIVLHRTQTPLSEPAAKPLRLLLHTAAGRFNPPAQSTSTKLAPLPAWPRRGVCSFLGGCVYWCVIGWGFSVEVTTESWTSNPSFGLNLPTTPRLWFPF